MATVVNNMCISQLLTEEVLKIKILCVWESPRTSTVLTHALGE